MGIAKMPNQRSFWEEDLSYTGVLSVLSRNQFETLIWTIHVVENLSLDPKRKEDDKLWKIRPRLENLWHNFRKMYPEEFNSVNEIMIPYMGKS